MEKLTDAKIKELKAKHGPIFKITVGDKTCVLKRPDRKTISYASSVGSKDPLKFNEIILKNCWLMGDEEIQTDDYLFMSASAKMGEIIDIKEAELEKL